MAYANDYYLVTNRSIKDRLLNWRIQEQYYRIKMAYANNNVPCFGIACYSDKRC